MRTHQTNDETLAHIFLNFLKEFESEPSLVVYFIVLRWEV